MNMTNTLHSWYPHVWSESRRNIGRCELTNVYSELLSFNFHNAYASINLSSALPSSGPRSVPATAFLLGLRA